MTKKLIFMSMAALLAVAAFSLMPAMASAATREYGTCTSKVAPETVPPCPVKDKFTPFVEGEAIPVLNKNVAGTGKFILQNEAEPANGVECEKLSGQGTLINLGGVGQSESTLVFEKCKGTGALAFCNTGKINGSEKIEGLVSDEVNSAGEDEVTVRAGFNIACEISTGSFLDLGGVTGGVTGQEVPGKGYETNFNKAKGEIFAGEPSTQTGTSESPEAFAPKAKTYVDAAGGGKPEFETQTAPPNKFKAEEVATAGVHVFTFLEAAKGQGAAKVLCEEAEATGEMKAKRELTLLIAPAYKKCYWWNKAEVVKYEKHEAGQVNTNAVTVQVSNGCKYKYAIEAGQARNQAQYEAELTLMPGCEVTFEKFAGVGACKATIKPGATPVKKVQLINEPLGGPPWKGLQVLHNIAEGLDYESAGCPAGFSGAIKPWAGYGPAPFQFGKTEIVVN